MFCVFFIFFFFKQKTAYEMRISDWSSDVCSSDLIEGPQQRQDSQRLLHRPALIGIDHEGRLAAEQRAQAAQAALVALLAEAHLQLEGAVTLVQLRADQALGAFRKIGRAHV